MGVVGQSARLLRKAIISGLTFAATIGTIVVVLLAATALYNLAFPAERDDTDPPNGRSGLKVMTDCATGVQYVSTSKGGLTPRLDEAGNLMFHYCTKGQRDRAERQAALEAGTAWGSAQ